MLYHKSPLYLMRGELIDPMRHVAHDGDADGGDDIEEGHFEPGRLGG
jgi:hypothetical protein